VEERVVNRRIGNPIGKVKFDTHSAGILDCYLDQLARIFDYLDENGFANFFCGVL